MSRAVIYTRVSTGKQEVNGDSLEIQEQECRADCEKNGAVVVAVESDTFTGHDSLYDRPGLQRALERIRSGEASLLVVKRVSRVVRDVTDGMVLLRDVVEAGGVLRSVVEGMTFTGKADDKLLLSIHCFQAEKDWETIRAQSQQGLQSRVARGRPLVSIPLFGYRYLDGELGEKYRSKSVVAIDPEAAPIVQDIFTRAATGQSIYSITNYLNEQGTITPSLLMQSRGQLGRRRLSTIWTPEMVHNILEKESYTGRHPVYRTKSVLVKRNDGKPVYKMSRRPPEETVSISIPALIDDVTWQNAKKTISSRHVTISDEPLLNQGIAICGVCGTKMVAARESTPPRYRIYRCRRRDYRLDGVCPGGSFVLKAENVDRDIWEKVKEIIRDEPRFKRLVQSKSAKLEDQQTGALRKAEMVQKELSEWQEKQATVFGNMSKETDDTIRGMYKTELLRINETVAGLEKRAKAAQISINLVQAERDGHAELMEMVNAAIASHKASYTTWQKRLPWMI
jgi:site-specific DNA recombinase